MKKYLLAVTAATCMLFLFALSVWALPLDAGTATLNAQFQDGETPNGYDYVWFSPVKDATDQTKYPLLVWLHGRQSGSYPRAQLERYEFSNWASDEYQARFANAGGCFLFAPRESLSGQNDWEGEMCGTLKYTIDSFIAAHAANIDTNRIYIAGYSTGGSMVWEMLVSYPDFFAAGMPLAALYQPSDTAQLEALKNTSLWIFTSDNDPYVINETADVRPTFEYIAGFAGDKSGLRMTSISEAFFADGSKKTEIQWNGKEGPARDAEHYIWEAVTYDMFMADGVTPYVCATTVDGTGETLQLDQPGDGVIRWLSQQSKENVKPEIQLSGLKRVIRFLYMLLDIIKELFFGRTK